MTSETENFHPQETGKIHHDEDLIFAHDSCEDVDRLRTIGAIVVRLVWPCSQSLRDHNVSGNDEGAETLCFSLVDVGPRSVLSDNGIELCP